MVTPPNNIHSIGEKGLTNGAFSSLNHGGNNPFVNRADPAHARDANAMLATTVHMCAQIYVVVNI